jgi:hypothetical protein
MAGLPSYMSFHLTSPTNTYVRDSTEIEICRNLLRAMREVYFLGFGFHRLNMERLATRTFDNPRKLAGTAFGMTPAEREAV